MAIPEHPRFRGKTAAQQHECLARPPLLDKADRGIEQKKCANDCCLVPFVQQDLDQNGHFQHPRDRPPEFLQQHQHRTRSMFRNFIRSKAFEAAFRFNAGQSERRACG
jgi:hypothetical protein